MALLRGGWTDPAAEALSQHLANQSFHFGTGQGGGSFGDHFSPEYLNIIQNLSQCVKSNAVKKSRLHVSIREN